VLAALLASVGVGLSLRAQQPAKPADYNPDADYRFRPDHERKELKGKSAYKKFQEQEGIPVYTNFDVNVYDVQLGPWKRQGPGVTGAYIDLDGAGAVVNAFVMEIPAGGRNNPERHVYEEQLLFLTGEGETQFWQTKDPSKKVTVPWREGTVFSPPLNVNYQHFNKGKEPARLVAVTDLPLKVDLFRNLDFIFGNDFAFSDRYDGQPDFFDPENSKDYAGNKTGHSLSIVNVVRNAWTWRLFHAGQGYRDVDRHFVLSSNTMTGHIEQFPTGTYQRAHRHGPSSTIVLLAGTGYSLMWPTSIGFTPYKDGKGDQVKRLDWKRGTMVVPPIQWFHMHFNNGKEPARFIKLGGTPGNELYPVTTKVLEGGERYTIMWKDEDPYFRELFVKELTKNGGQLSMPPIEELAKVEKELGETSLTIP
jgi:oxalate decarboxylase/phosphoglucose isomerase-like protein (cupin superfamily)